MTDAPNELLKPLTNAVMLLDGVYGWVDRIDKLGGATTISGIAECHAMLKSLRANRKRMETLVIAPSREAIAKVSP